MNPLDRRAYAVITAAWALAVLLVIPAGNFPLIDDWSYAWAVNSLVANGEWRLHDWTSMPLGPQILWGAGFSSMFGVSFDTLRASTLCLAWLGTVGIYTLMRQCGAARSTALLLAAAIAVGPFFFSLSFTFMSDVPAIAIAVWALVSAVRFLETQRRADLVLCVALLTATTLIRQAGVALVVGCAAAIVFTVPHKKSRAIATLMLLLVPVAALALYNLFLDVTHKPALYSGNEQEVVRVLTTAPVEAANRMRLLGSVFYLYLGFLLLPVVWLIRMPASTKARVAVGTALAASLGYMPFRGRTLPMLGGTLYDLAVYPLTMARSDLWPRAPRWLWFTVTMAALTGSVLIAFAVFRALRPAWRRECLLPHRRATVMLAVVALLAHLLPFTLVHPLDRHLLVPAILLMMLIVSADGFNDAVPKFAIAAATATILAFAAFDIAATRDYFAFSRARWTAMENMLAERIPADEIRGGLEVSGWLGATRGANVEEIRQWANYDPPVTAVISLGPLPGFTTRRSYEFPRLIGTRPAMVYDLRRVAQ